MKSIINSHDHSYIGEFPKQWYIYHPINLYKDVINDDDIDNGSIVLTHDNITLVLYDLDKIVQRFLYDMYGIENMKCDVEYSLYEYDEYFNLYELDNDYKHFFIYNGLSSDGCFMTSITNVIGSFLINYGEHLINKKLFDAYHDLNDKLYMNIDLSFKIDGNLIKITQFPYSSGRITIGNKIKWGYSFGEEILLHSDYFN